jgi:septum formation protein
MEKTEIFHCITKVTFNSLSENAIYYYLENYEPFDKAGSYGIQDWIGLIGISNIEGSYTNVVGLPTELLFQKLITYV